MKIIAILSLVVSVASCVSRAEKIADVRVEIISVECESGRCVALHFENQFDKAVCIKNTSFPYAGNLNENVFLLRAVGATERSKYKLIEPSMVTNAKNAILVRLVPVGGSAISTIDLSSFYELAEGQIYALEYKSRAFFCDRYGDGQDFVLLSGAMEKLD
ncbi:MAG: hypothetical protein WD002_03960 [Pseudomonadales bacterium]